ncbi:hypothetical protein MVEN_02616300 [Mycena venus]|uniref:Fatty acid desaturase domain-containing protein n=1 Tax=Mycena venus TaxID=2733690 RepID=A0A8H6U101_9AGAR|nr:hypothetical protein MVEN_02616300 [Mycena venus]
MSTTLTLLESFKTTSLPKDVLSPADRQTVFAQIRHFRQKLPREILEKHEKPLSWLSMRQLIMDWGVAFCIMATPLAHFQCLHFCACALFHFNLFSSKRWNYFVGDFLMCPSLMATMRSQREAHVAHHNYLGSEQDPDHGLGNKTSLKHYRNKNFTHKSIWALFLYDVLDAKLFLQHAAGSLNDHALHIVVWWAAFALLLGPLERPIIGIPLPIAWRFFAPCGTCRAALSCMAFTSSARFSIIPAFRLIQSFRSHGHRRTVLHSRSSCSRTTTTITFCTTFCPSMFRNMSGRTDTKFISEEHGLLTQELHREMVL